MTNEEYHQLPGLSNSGIGDLAVSPLRYWHLHINPEREPVESTPFQEFGSAVHCAVLEPNQFPQRYCQKLHAEAGMLDTVKDMRAHLDSLGMKARGTLKADIIEQVLAVDPDAQIFAILEAEWAEKNEGKVAFNADDWERVKGASAALLEEPEIQKILAQDGEFEKVYRVDYNGVKLRSRMDYVTPDVTLDLKTITAKRGQSFDESVTKAIWYEKYYRQAYFYSLVRHLAGEGESPQKAPRFVLAFVESQPPHEVRIRELRPKAVGQVNMLWEQGRIEVEGHIELYKQYQKKFGDKRWRYAQKREPLLDEEFPGLAFS